MKYIILECIPSTILLHTPSPIPGILSTNIIFLLHTYVHNICTIFTLLLPFLTSYPLPPVPSPQSGPVLPSCSPILYKNRRRRKNDIFKK
jgi:hypothetical protein